MKFILALWLDFQVQIDNERKKRCGFALVEQLLQALLLYKMDNKKSQKISFIFIF